MLDAFAKSLIPAVADGALTTLLKSVTSSWVTCGGHTISSVLKRLFDHKKYAKAEISDYTKTYEAFRQFAKLAPKRQKRTNEKCLPCFHNVVWDAKPNPVDTMAIAKLRHPNMKKMPQAEQDAIIKQIDQYPLPSRVSDVRFTSVADQLKNVLGVKNVFADLQFNKSCNLELVNEKDFPIDWSILEEMNKICDEIIPHLKFFEKTTEFTMSQYVNRLFDIYNWALQSEDSEDDSQDDELTLNTQFKQLIAKIMDEYIFGTTQIISRISPFTLTAWFLDFENSALCLNLTKKLVQKSKLSNKESMIKNLDDCMLEWPNVVDELIGKVDEEVNAASEYTSPELDPSIAKRLKFSGLPEDSTITSNGTIADDLRAYRGFGKTNRGFGLKM